MTDKLEVLRAYQAWRRGEDERTMQEAGLNPETIGAAIDWAIAELERVREPASLSNMLVKDLQILTDASNGLASAASYVCQNYDGIHRLRLAIARWYMARANEGGRGTQPRPAVPDGWRPIKTAPEQKQVILRNAYGLACCGEKRYGLLGEPNQGVFAWRGTESGKFFIPTHWMPLP